MDLPQIPVAEDVTPSGECAVRNGKLFNEVYSNIIKLKLHLP
jgi:hypothetical protein